MKNECIRHVCGAQKDGMTIYTFEPDPPDSGKPLLVDVCQGLGIYGRVSPDVSAVSRVPVSVGQQPLLET